MKDSMGFVWLKGLVKNGVTSAAIFTLPAGYRPLAELYIACTANASAGVVRVDAGGNVKHDTGSNAAFSLDTVRFKAED